MLGSYHNYLPLYVVLFILNPLSLTGQNNLASRAILNTEIILGPQDQEAKDILESISNKTQMHLSYNPKHLQDSMLHLGVDTVTVSKLIQHLFKPPVGVKIVQQQLIIYKETGDGIPISGCIKDKLTKQPVENAEIRITTDNTLYTKANSEGCFTMLSKHNINEKLALNIRAENYISREVTLEKTSDIEILLIGDYISLEEVIILSVNPYEIVEKSLKSIKNNYYNAPYVATAFFREFIQKRKKPMGIAEAVLAIKKPGYDKPNKKVVTELIKGRKLIDHQSLDTLQFRTKGSIKSCNQLDLIKENPPFFSLASFDQYHFYFSDIRYFNDVLVYVIEFKKKEHAKGIPYNGFLYITEKNLTLKSVEFSIDPQQIGKLTDHFVVKKPKKVRVKPKSAKYTVEYRTFGEKSILSYVHLETKFKVRKRKSLFYEEYTTTAEMVLNEIDTTTHKESKTKSDFFFTNKVFLDQTVSYDPDYWKSFNYLPLDQQLTELIKQIPTNNP